MDYLLPWNVPGGLNMLNITTNVTYQWRPKSMDTPSQALGNLPVYRNTNCECHFINSVQKYLFSSPSEICHWNSSVWDSVSSPESSEDLSEVSSQSAESSQGCESLSSYGMENSTYRPASGASQWSPETTSEEMPDTFFQTGVWMDATQMPGNAPFSPVLSDFTLPSSDVGFSSIGQAATQELSMVDPFVSAHWSAEVADRSYIDESGPTEQSFFPFPEHSQPEVAQAGFQSWFSPSTEVNFENYFQMDQPQGQVAGFTPVAPQTAGFVGSAPFVPSSHAGPYQTSASASGQFGSVTAAAPQSQAGPHGAQIMAPVGVACGPFPHAGQSPELREARPPRRLSVAVSSSASWSPRESRLGAGSFASGYGQVLSAVPVLGSHRSSNASAMGSACSVVSSAASSTAPVKIERSLSATSLVSMAARSEDNEGKPRSHKYYTTARPQPDGYYHCPYVQAERCPHKPTKLKCNYDKYIDSHLKPFVCKQDGCRGVENENRFSSTACLLRHEREAHGLHGHGNKPYTCKYKGCERSIPGNGFPRNYNLMDHMKRVHRHNPEEKAPSTPGSASGKRGGRSDTNKVRKRKVTDMPKRTNSTSSRRNAASPAPTLQGQEYNSQEMAEFNACKDKLQQQLRRMEDPRQAATLQHLSRQIAQRFR